MIILLMETVSALFSQPYSTVKLYSSIFRIQIPLDFIGNKYRILYWQSHNMFVQFGVWSQIFNINKIKVLLQISS